MALLILLATATPTPCMTPSFTWRRDNGAFAIGGDPWRLLRVPLLGGDARDRLLHLRCKAAPGRICAVGLCLLRCRELTAKLCDSATPFHKHMVTHHRVILLVHRQGIKHLREGGDGPWVPVFRHIDRSEFRGLLTEVQERLGDALVLLGAVAQHGDDSFAQILLAR